MSIKDVLTLERIEKNIFRGQSQDIGTPQVFGGQVLAQALQSAQATVEDRFVHSVHAYFLNKGDFEAPIIYEVDRSRDRGRPALKYSPRNPTRVRLYEKMLTS